MGKVTKVTIKYRGGELPENIGELLSEADEGDLRILATLLMRADGESGTASTADIDSLLGMDPADVNASLKFWRGAGVIGNSKAQPTGKKAEEKKDGKQEQAIPSAHRNGVLERSGVLSEYTSAELAELMEKRRVSAQFVDEAQRILGKVFRTYDTGILVALVDQLGFEEEAVLAILAYVAKRGKKTLRYAEKMAIGLYDDGITDTYAVLERIDLIERSAEEISKIRSLFGSKDRELTATEKKLFSTWTEKFGYDIDIIRMAYDITVDKTQKPLPKYANSILEKWYSEGLRTADDVIKYTESQRTGGDGVSSTAKSYDLEDFFEASLQRSFEGK